MAIKLHRGSYNEHYQNKNMACKIITKLWDFPFQDEFNIDNIDQGEPYSRSGYENK